MLAEFLDAVLMKGSGSRSEFSACILPEILDGHMAEIDLREGHGSSVHCRFCFRIYIVDEYTHPLFSGSVGIHRAA